MRSVEDLVADHRRLAAWVANRIALACGIRRTQDVDDLVQESMLALYIAARSWDADRGPFVPWAIIQCRAAVQKSIRSVRHVDHRTNAPIFVRLGAQIRVDPWADLEERDEQAALQDAADRAIESLKDGERLLFRRYWESGDTMASLARREGVTHQAISLRLAKIMGRVREAAVR